MDWRTRYQQAHELNFKEQFPIAYKDGHYSLPVYPKVSKSNGLTKMIIMYLTWTGQYGNRINTMGKLIDGTINTESGARLRVKQWLPSTTKKGTADINCIIKGTPVAIEIKIGRDTQSDDQIKEQARFERAGGKYFIVKTPEDFFVIYDSLI
jgi:hypothetical protein